MSRINFFVLSLLSFLFYINCNNDEDLKSIINEYESSTSQLKLISCLNLVHSFLSQRDGDQKLKKMIKNTNFPHNQLFKKFITLSIKKCTDNIKSNQINYLLTMENTDNYNTLNSSITNLIKSNEEIKSVELTKEEEYIYNKISKNIIDYENKSKNKKNKGFFQKYKTIIITILLIIIGCILFYLRYLKNPIKEVKKDNNNKTEEINKKVYRRRKKN